MGFLEDLPRVSRYFGTQGFWDTDVISAGPVVASVDSGFPCNSVKALEGEIEVQIASWTDSTKVSVKYIVLADYATCK